MIPMWRSHPERDICPPGAVVCGERGPIPGQSKTYSKNRIGQYEADTLAVDPLNGLCQCAETSDITPEAEQSGRKAGPTRGARAPKVHRAVDGLI